MRDSCLAPGPLIVAVAAALALSAPGLRAAELVLTPARDTSIFQGSGFDNNADGAGPHLWTSVTAGAFNRRALLAFDLSAIPPGSTVLSVQLSLYQSRARDSHAVTLHRLTESWGEGSSNAGSSGAGALASAGDATWVSRFHPGMPWAAAGGSFHPVASASLAVGLPGEACVWGSTPALVADVQRWVNAPGQNHGWVLIGDEAGNQNAKRFESRENPAAVNRPQLRVSFEPPPPADTGDIPLPLWATALLAGGMGWGLWRRPR